MSTSLGLYYELFARKEHLDQCHWLWIYYTSFSQQLYKFSYIYMYVYRYMYVNTYVAPFTNMVNFDSSMDK